MTPGTAEGVSYCSRDQVCARETDVESCHSVIIKGGEKCNQKGGCPCTVDGKIARGDSSSKKIDICRFEETCFTDGAQVVCAAGKPLTTDEVCLEKSCICTIDKKLSAGSILISQKCQQGDACTLSDQEHRPKCAVKVNLKAVTFFTGVCFGNEVGMFTTKGVVCKTGQYCDLLLLSPVCVDKAVETAYSGACNVDKGCVCHYPAQDAVPMMCLFGEKCIKDGKKGNKGVCQMPTDRTLIAPDQLCPNVKGGCVCKQAGKSDVNCYGGTICKVSGSKLTCSVKYSIWECWGTDACACRMTSDWSAQKPYCLRTEDDNSSGDYGSLTPAQQQNTGNILTRDLIVATYRMLIATQRPELLIDNKRSLALRRLELKI